MEIVKPRYYQCGVCELLHHIAWGGKCPNLEIGWTMPELDQWHGGDDGWQEVTVKEAAEHLRAQRGGELS
jgi:hypothetical protein